jgi:predicted CXXCH cytochrome family protein
MIKRAKAITWLAGMIFVLTGLFGGEALAAIATTKHNLSSTPAVGTTIYSSDQTEICIFCHTPHAAIKNANIPLWNHNLSTTVSYGVYASPTFDASVAKGGDIADVGNVTEASATASNLCLSCHDGTVAINSFANPSNQAPLTTMLGTTGGLMPTGPTNLGSDLTNDHPVNFTYDAALVTRDGSLKDPATLTGVRLYTGKVQCASCHDPHTSADPSGRSFLRVSMSQSTLCMACHSK